MFLDKLNKITKAIKPTKRNQGATAMEYVLIVTILIVLLVATYKRLGGGYLNIYNRISNAVP